MSVKLKFRVDSKSEQLQSVRNADGSGYTNKRIGSVKLLPVTGGSSDNEQFYQWKAGRIRYSGCAQEPKDRRGGALNCGDLYPRLYWYGGAFG